jgi:hypothetical protein
MNLRELELKRGVAGEDFGVEPGLRWQMEIILLGFIQGV